MTACTAVARGSFALLLAHHQGTPALSACSAPPGAAALVPWKARPSRGAPAGDWGSCQRESMAQVERQGGRSWRWSAKERAISLETRVTTWLTVACRQEETRQRRRGK